MVGRGGRVKRGRIQPEGRLGLRLIDGIAREGRAVGGLDGIKDFQGMDRSETPARRIGRRLRETRRGGFIVPQPGQWKLVPGEKSPARRDLEIDRIDCLIPNAEFLWEIFSLL